MKRAWAILRLRCPRCLEGRVFQGMLRMHPKCLRCGLSFEREPGYYLGAMYFSYTLAVLFALPSCVVLFFLNVPAIWNALAGAGEIALISPFLVRYSRVLWLHFDQRFNPS